MNDPRRRSKLLFQAVVGLLISAGFVAILWPFLDGDQLWTMLREMRMDLAIYGLCMWVVLYMARALRFVLLAPRTPFATMLCVAAVHNLLLRLLPMRTGELAYAFLVRRAGTAGLGESLLGLVLLRLLDSTVVVLVFSAALALDSGGLYRGDRGLGLLAAALAAGLGLGMIFLLAPSLRLGLRGLRQLARGLGLDGKPLYIRGLDALDQAVTAFGQVRPRVLVLLAGATLCVWAMTFGAFGVLMQAFGVPVNLPQVILGSTLGIVTAFLPLSGIGSFGTLEAGWTLGFVLVGVDRGAAVASGFGISIMTFLYAAMLGLPAWVAFELLVRRRPQINTPPHHPDQS